MVKCRDCKHFVQETKVVTKTKKRQKVTKETRTKRIAEKIPYNRQGKIVWLYKKIQITVPKVTKKMINVPYQIEVPAPLMQCELTKEKWDIRECQIEHECSRFERKA